LLKIVIEWTDISEGSKATLVEDKGVLSPAGEADGRMAPRDGLEPPTQWLTVSGSIYFAVPPPPLNPFKINGFSVRVYTLIPWITRSPGDLLVTFIFCCRGVNR